MFHTFETPSRSAFDPLLSLSSLSLSPPSTPPPPPAPFFFFFLLALQPKTVKRTNTGHDDSKGVQRIIVCRVHSVEELVEGGSRASRSKALVELGFIRGGM